MPNKLNKKRLTKREHRIWKKVQASAKKQGARSPAAVATAVVKKARKKGKPS